MKPQAIRDLEIAFGITLEELSEGKDIMDRDFQNTFQLNAAKEVIGLNIAGNEIQDISPLKELNKLRYLDFSNNQVRNISPLEKLVQLTTLHFYWNQVSDIGSLEKLVQLTELYFPYNQVSDIRPLEKLDKLLHLYFGGNQVSNINSLRYLGQLHFLDFSYNTVGNISSLQHLVQLQLLDFSYNQVRDISPLVKLITLTNLGFSNNQAVDIRPLKELTALTNLDFSNNQVVDISPLSELTTLTNLDFSNNRVSKIHPLEKLTELMNLNFGYNQVSDLRPLKKVVQLTYLNFQNNEVGDVSFLEELIKLNALYFGSNQVQDISSLRKLSQLQNLEFGNNQVQDISYLKNLNNLGGLYFWENQVQDIFPLKGLHNLQELELSSNQVQDISLDFLQSLPSLKQLLLRNNPIISINPVIISEKNCLSSLKNYLQDLAQGSEPNNEVKIVLIGNGSVGKTQIARRLEYHKVKNTAKGSFFTKFKAFFSPRFKLEKVHKSTHAIELRSKQLPCSFLSAGLVLNIWDFGGQDIYHATHRLFMQTRALFVLVWDNESETKETHLYNGVEYQNYNRLYWLHYAHYFGGDSPILVVQNKIDKDSKERDALAEVQYKDRFPTIVGFHRISAKMQPQDNFEGFVKGLVEVFQNDKTLHEDLQHKLLPKSWVKMRQRVRVAQKRGKKMLDRKTFEAWCGEEGVPNSTETLLNFFHQTGVFFYQTDCFDGKIMLDQAWAISAVYQVLNKESTYCQTLMLRKDGTLNYEDMRKIWTEEDDKEREMFIEFMLSCELCFETTPNKQLNTPLKDRSFVVPQLLPPEALSPLSGYIEEGQLPLIEEREYPFLPTSLIHRFIIQAHEFAQPAEIWQKGILLRYKEARAWVEVQYGLPPHRLKIHYNETAKSDLLPAIIEEWGRLMENEMEKTSVLAEKMDDIVKGMQRLGKQNKAKDSSTNYNNLHKMEIQEEASGFLSRLFSAIPKQWQLLAAIIIFAFIGYAAWRYLFGSPQSENKVTIIGTLINKATGQPLSDKIDVSLEGNTFAKDESVINGQFDITGVTLPDNKIIGLVVKYSNGSSAPIKNIDMTRYKEDTNTHTIDIGRQEVDESPAQPDKPAKK
ncbi:MAG: leucine-rich repeat domain-containing protein [Bacteroidia bacterium]